MQTNGRVRDSVEWIQVSGFSSVAFAHAQELRPGMDPGQTEALASSEDL